VTALGSCDGALTFWQSFAGIIAKEDIDADEGGCTRMHADGTRLNELSGHVIGCAFTVLNTLGAGFLEKVYENALAHELRKTGLAVAQQRGITVTYDGTVVGEYCVDLLVDQALLVELKTVKALNEAHHAQCLNYLKATHLQLCLLLNFGNPRLEIKRVAHRL
jgi:GxxExxY protein